MTHMGHYGSVSDAKCGKVSQPDAVSPLSRSRAISRGCEQNELTKHSSQSCVSIDYNLHFIRYEKINDVTYLLYIRP